MVDIPNLPGVPPLLSYAVNTVALLVSDLISAGNPIFGSPWGIFLDGEQAFDYSSVLDVDYKQDYPLSDYQQEDGGFQSYDKVQMPFDVKVRVASYGDEAGREATLASVLAASKTLDLYDVVMPEMTISSCNITHVDFKRSSHNGVGMIVMDIWFLEIRITATSTFSGTQSPAVAGQQNTGNVSTTAPSQQTSGLLFNDDGTSAVG